MGPANRGRGARGGARGGRGRGRGRGRGFSRFGPQRRFDSARTAEKDESDSEGSEASASEDDGGLVDSASDDESQEEEETGTGKPYMALLHSLAEPETHMSKRRKLDHQQAVEREAESSSDEQNGSNRDVDEVDEPEDPALGEGEEDDDDADSVDDQDDEDPFDSHFAHCDEEALSHKIDAVKRGKWKTKKMLLGSLRMTLQIPETEQINEDLTKPSRFQDLKLKQKLRESASKGMGDFDEAQRSLAAPLSQYRDILYCDRRVDTSESLRKLVCLHALNHVFKTRDRVIKDNLKLAKEGNDSELELRDQGFTRPKVLFLLPTRNSCAKIVNIIRDLCEADQQENRKRFDESYISKEGNFGADRPEDFRELFEGNDDDMFRLGMKFTRKTIKYFAQFYNSDILFASPLGLRMAIGSEEEKKVDYDFLSSIEMVVMDQADGLLMQNWEHVEFIFEHLNLQPKDAHDCDFSRVRNWYLEDWAKYFRQTIVMSAFNTPELSELQRIHCHNWEGKVRMQPEYPGVLQQLGIKTRQTFSRFNASSVDKEPDARFNYFITTIVPSLVKRAKDSTGTLIFIPSYLDFVRVRNYFANDLSVSSVTFGAISEYADVPEASRARSHFLNGRHRVLLYTERAHHFRRYQLRGVQRVILYGLPDNPIFYKEMCGGYLGKSEEDMRIEAGRGSVRVLFSKYDVMKLERVVGSKRVGKMIQDKGDTFDFV